MKHISLYVDNLFIEGWTIGVCQGNIKDFIRTKSFKPDINWLRKRPIDNYFADPFLFKTKDGNYNILVEEYDNRGGYGKISLMTIDKNLKPSYLKTLLDTKSHLSYPFIFTENDRTYIFPEAGETGKLLCYEYDAKRNSLVFLQEIMDIPIVDPTILKYNNKYWLFGSLKGKNSQKQLYIYFSDNLLGPYQPHGENPVKNTSNGSRCAGNFIEVDGVIYRPSQNCENQYGESITINKVNVLDEFHYDEEQYMSININKKNKRNDGIYKIHTINVIDDIILVDGGLKIFSPIEGLRRFFKRKFSPGT